MAAMANPATRASRFKSIDMQQVAHLRPLVARGGAGRSRRATRFEPGAGQHGARPPVDRGQPRLGHLSARPSRGSDAASAPRPQATRQVGAVADGAEKMRRGRPARPGGTAPCGFGHGPDTNPQRSRVLSRPASANPWAISGMHPSDMASATQTAAQVASGKCAAARARGRAASAPSGVRSHLRGEPDRRARGG